MESHDDEAKRRHHTDLIRLALEERFQQASEIRVVRSPETLAAVFHLDLEEAPSEYRLRVPRAVLEDSRRDSEIERMVVRATASMRDHPHQLVTVNNDLSLFVFYTPR